MNTKQILEIALSETRAHNFTLENEVEDLKKLLSQKEARIEKNIAFMSACKAAIEEQNIDVFKDISAYIKETTNNLIEYTKSHLSNDTVNSGLYAHIAGHYKGALERISEMIGFPSQDDRIFRLLNQTAN